VVDVAAQRDDRGRGVAALACPRGADELDDLVERMGEGAPVLEVERSPRALPEALHQWRPRSPSDRVVPGLKVVDGLGQKDRQGVRDDQVPNVAGHDLLQPVPLLVVEHPPGALT
jgi:hypothetical protein